MLQICQVIKNEYVQYVIITAIINYCIFYISANEHTWLFCNFEVFRCSVVLIRGWCAFQIKQKLITLNFKNLLLDSKPMVSILFFVLQKSNFFSIFHRFFTCSICNLVLFLLQCDNISNKWCI